ncbi:hypothetical protein ABIB57_002341 [Devosia sp. UYZn731]|uniref:hypothetical protein n=1 Tax=Devosia sp. UYZn731 TaxID=3156345 RepID=UPI00339B01A5
MAISSDYPRPITVNGFLCRNCDDVSEAKKFIDPAKPTGSMGTVEASDNDPQRAVNFGGTLSFLNTVSPANPSPSPAADIGQRYDKVA